MNIFIVGNQCAGKTSIAKALGAHIVKFAEPHYAINDLLGVPKYRKFMQEVTDVIKNNFGTNIFAELFKRKYQGISNDLVCDDCRYQLEFDVLKKLGWQSCYVHSEELTRRERAQAQGLDFLPFHDSETAIKSLSHQCDYTIVNENISMQELKELSRKLLLED